MRKPYYTLIRYLGLSHSARSTREANRAMQRRSDWKLWFWWILVTSGVGTIGLALSDALVVGLPEVAFSGDNTVFPMTIWSSGLLFIAAPSFGFAQELILRRWIGQQLSWAWVAATVLGVLGAMVVDLAANICIFIGAGLVMPGFVLGFAQWIVLRHYVQRAAWWILACTIGWILALILGWVLLTALLPKEKFDGGIALPFFPLPFYPIESVVYWGIIAFAGLVVVQALTGMALKLILSSPGSKPSPRAKGEQQD